MAGKGFYDPLLVNESWFDTLDSNKAWFDPLLLDSVAGAATTPFVNNVSVGDNRRRNIGSVTIACNLLLTTLAVATATTVLRVPTYQQAKTRPAVYAVQPPNLLTSTLAVAVTPAPFVPELWPGVQRYPGLPDDTSAGLSKVLTADAQLPVGDLVQCGTISAPRNVADTSQSTPDALQVVVVPALPPGEPSFCSLPRFWYQNPDTTQETPKSLTGDAQVPVGGSPEFAPVALVRNVVDTTQKQPITLQVIVPPAPIVNPPHFGPVKFFWQPADTSEGASKGLIPDAQLPVQNVQLTPPDRVRPVTDTSQSTPESLLPVAVVPLPVGQASFVGLQRFWHQPLDTSQSTQRTLDPIPLPPGEAAFVGLQRALWQPADASQEAYAVSYPPAAILPPPIGTALVLPVPQYAWPVSNTTAESPPVAIQGVLPPVDIPYVQPPQGTGGHGKPHRRRHYLEIDGQYFEVKDEADAIRIVKALNEAAKEAAPVAVKAAIVAKKAAPVIPKMTVVKSNYRPDFVKQLQAQVDAANAVIAQEYQRAAESYAAWQAQQDEDDEISVLLTLGIL